MIGWLKRWEVAVRTHHGVAVESRHIFYGAAKAEALLRDQIACAGGPTIRTRYVRKRKR